MKRKRRPKGWGVPILSPEQAAGLEAERLAGRMNGTGRGTRMVWVRGKGFLYYRKDTGEQIGLKPGEEPTPMPPWPGEPGGPPAGVFTDWPADENGNPTPVRPHGTDAAAE